MHGHYSSIWQAIGQREPDRPAVVTRSRTMTYGELAAEAGSLARALRDAGLRPGDGVMINMYNRPEYLVALYACFASGLAPVLVNFRFRAPELAQLLDDSTPSAILFVGSLGEVVTDAVRIADREADTTLIRIDDGEGAPIEGALDYREVTAQPGDLPAQPPEGGELRIYTGGTTGRPKAVVWPAEVILDVQDYSIYTSIGLPSPTTLDEAVDIALAESTPRVALLPLAPFMHGTALFNGINALAVGGSVVIPDARRLDAHDGVRLANEQRATRLIVAGDVVTLPIVEAAEELGVRLETVTSVMSSGMRFSDEVKRRLHEIGDLQIIDLLAATEGGPFAVNVTHGVDELPGRLQLMPGAIVLDADMNEVQEKPGATGVLAFRGALPTGYHGDEAKTRESFPVINGVRHVMPGDWVKVLEGGAIELLGRGSSVVNTGGEKVYPAEVEDAILEHPAVHDVVVFGAPDPRYGERVVAVAEVEPGMSVSFEELTDHLNTRIAGYKRPKQVAFVDSLERTPHGKLNMVRMRDVLEASTRTDANATTVREQA